jgi:DNA-binding IscR family transcriptional regulator
MKCLTIMIRLRRHQRASVRNKFLISFLEVVRELEKNTSRSTECQSNDSKKSKSKENPISNLDQDVNDFNTQTEIKVKPQKKTLMRKTATKELEKK